MLQLAVKLCHQVMHLPHSSFISNLAGGKAGTVDTVVDSTVHLHLQNNRMTTPLKAYLSPAVPSHGPAADVLLCCLACMEA